MASFGGDHLGCLYGSIRYTGFVSRIWWMCSEPVVRVLLLCVGHIDDHVHLCRQSLLATAGKTPRRKKMSIRTHRSMFRPRCRHIDSVRNVVRLHHPRHSHRSTMHAAMLGRWPDFIRQWHQCNANTDWNRLISCSCRTLRSMRIRYIRATALLSFENEKIIESSSLIVISSTIVTSGLEFKGRGHSLSFHIISESLFQNL